jgi:hypothetical protein
MKPGRKAIWGIICVSILCVSLTWVLSSHGRADSSKDGKADGAKEKAAMIGAASTVSVAQTIARARWTAVASTGTVDEDSLHLFDFGSEAGISRATFKSFSKDDLVIRYNVTNTFDNSGIPNIPGWTIFELGYSVTPGWQVVAKLIRVRRCDGLEEVICNVKSPMITGGRVPICDTCKADSKGPIDFTDFLYYVELTMGEHGCHDEPGCDPACLDPHPTLWPEAYTLRIY